MPRAKLYADDASMARVNAADASTNARTPLSPLIHGINPFWLTRAAFNGFRILARARDKRGVYSARKQ